MFNIENTEKQVLQLYGIFTAISTLAMSINSPSAEDSEVEKVSESINDLTVIAAEKLDVIWANVSEIETEKGKEFYLAERIVELLDSSVIPNELYHKIIAGLDEIADKGGFKTLKQIETSPEYISNILKDYREGKGE